MSWRTVRLPGVGVRLADLTLLNLRGSCGFRCAPVLANAQCQGGSCQCLAPAPDECNHDACTNLTTDPKNCGGCNNACPLQGEVCLNGACSCPSSLPDVCGASPGACVDEARDPKNCGACGNGCASGATCSASACHCPASAPDVCGTSPGTCVDEARDPKNCGACGTRCPSAATCSSGSCACPAANPTLCGNSSDSPGSCCAGPACCGKGCETIHSNGLGESYYDCGKTGTFSQAQAIAAAQAFAPTGTVVLAPLCASCVCVNTDSQAAIFCYAGSQLAGLGQLFDVPDCTQAFCPTPGFSTTFHWN